MVESKEESATPDISNMTKLQKLASLLVLLGRDNAAKIMSHLDRHEIEAVSAEMSKISMLSHGLQKAILNEFAEVATEARTAVLGGLDYTQRTLEQSVGLYRATEIVNRVIPDRAPVDCMEQIAEMEPRQIFNLIKTEQPQTIALIVSYLPPDKGARVIMECDEKLRDEVVERLATLAPTPIEVVEKIVDVLNQKMGGNDTRALNQTGGLKNAADVLNAMKKELSKALLSGLDERNPELSQSIRQKMFTFEDLANLDQGALQKILREVDMKDLALALKTSSANLKNSMLGCISKRAAESVHEEISFLGNVKLRDIEAAQQRVIEIVRRLEAEGEIEIDGSGEDDDEGAST